MGFDQGRAVAFGDRPRPGWFGLADPALLGRDQGIELALRGITVVEVLQGFGPFEDHARIIDRCIRLVERGGVLARGFFPRPQAAEVPR